MLLCMACLIEVVPRERSDPQLLEGSGRPERLVEGRASWSRQEERAHPPLQAGDERACVRCHRDVTTHRVMHGPAAAEDCVTCHRPVARGRRLFIGLTHGARADATSRLCVSCHDEIGSRMRDAHVHAPVAAGDCVACHDPHGAAFRFQLAAEGNSACVTCHEDIAQALDQPFAHSPAKASCRICHDAHAGKYPSQLRGPVNAVCLTCHFDRPADGSGNEVATLFGTALAARADLLTAGPRIALDSSRRSGHPNIGHPVEGPTDPGRKGRALTCASCHNPHGASHRTLLRFEASGVSSLCIRCHPF
jgi:predicted CXXCH cytochrome family protein